MPPVKSEELWRSVTEMQHRAPDPSCPLCAVWGLPYDPADPSTHRRQHVHAAALWEAWDGLGGWEERVVATAAKLGVTCTAEQAAAHFAKHRVEQPYLFRPMRKELLFTEIALLPEAAREIMVAVYRQRILSREQIARIFTASRKDGDHAAETRADRILSHLVRMHLLYRYYPPAQADWPARIPTPSGRFLRGTYYFAGRALEPWVRAHMHGPVSNKHFVGIARQVGLEPLVHDLACSQVFVDLTTALATRKGLVEQGEEVLYCDASPANWYGSRLASFRFFDRTQNADVDMRPDGFCSLSVDRSGYGKGAVAPCQLPFFYEWDRGSKTVSSVADQLLDYHRLAVSGAVGGRFPDLAVPGYAVPLVAIFPDHARSGFVIRSFRREAEKAHFDRGTPIFATTATAWARDPFTAPLIHVWDGREVRLLDALLRASSALREQGALLPRHTLRYEYKRAALPHTLRRPASTEDVPEEVLADLLLEEGETIAQLPAVPVAGEEEENSEPPRAPQTVVPTPPPAAPLELAAPIAPQTTPVPLAPIAPQPVARPAPIEPTPAAPVSPKPAPAVAPEPASEPASATPSQKPAAPPSRRRSADTGFEHLLGGR